MSMSCSLWRGIYTPHTRTHTHTHTHMCVRDSASPPPQQLDCSVSRVFL